VLCVEVSGGVMYCCFGFWSKVEIVRCDPKISSKSYFSFLSVTWSPKQDQRLRSFLGFLDIIEPPYLKGSFLGFFKGMRELYVPHK